MLRLLFLVTLVGLSLHVEAAHKKPHIIFILADDLGWQDVGFHGTNLIPTPNIDALAYSGVIMQNYYVAPVCSPTRAAIMTARHPVRTGMWERVINATQPYGLGLEEKIFPQYLKDYGYDTHMLGKWHLGFFRAPYSPAMRGFDTFFGHMNARIDYYNYSHTAVEGWNGYDLFDGMNHAVQETGEYITRVYTKKAVEIIEAHNTHKPLFMYLSHTAGHTTNPPAYIQAPQETIDKMSTLLPAWRRKQAATIHEMDTSVGAVMEALSNKNMLNNSIIIFTTDNGGAVAYFPVSPGSNWPLRSGKVTTWEGGVRGSCFVWSPLIKNMPRVSKQLLHAQDWLPTVLGSFGKIPSGAQYTLDGVNAWEALNNPEAVARDEVLILIDPSAHFAALRQGKWKLTVGSPTYGLYDNLWLGKNENALGSYDIQSVLQSPAALAVAKATGYVLTEEEALKTRHSTTLGACPVLVGPSCISSSQKPCLFDLEVDYCEKVDVSDQYPEVVELLMATLARHNATVVPTRSQAPDPEANPALYGGKYVPWYDITHPLPTDTPVYSEEQV